MIIEAILMISERPTKNFRFPTKSKSMFGGISCSAIGDCDLLSNVECLDEFRRRAQADARLRELRGEWVGAAAALASAAAACRRDLLHEVHKFWAFSASSVRPSSSEWHTFRQSKQM